MQASRIIQYGTDDAQNPWCVVEETTHRDYYDNASVRRVCTVNSILTRRSLDSTTSTRPSANIHPTTSTALPANIQEISENLENPTDDYKDRRSKKSQKKVTKSLSRRKKFFRVLLCCSSGAVDADDDMYDTKPIDPPHSVNISATTDNAQDQNRPSENVRRTSDRSGYGTVENEWSVIPESQSMEYYRQTASSGEYDATITQAVRRQSAISTAQDSSVIQVLMEQRHYECILARVSEDLGRHREGVNRSSVVIRELSPTNTRIQESAIVESIPETTSRIREDVSSPTNLTSGEQNQTRNKPRRRSGKRVSFGSMPTLSAATPGPLQRNSAGGSTCNAFSPAVSSFCSENPLHQYQDETDTSVRHEPANVENMIKLKNVVPVKSALKVHGAAALNTHNDVTNNSNNDVHKTSTSPERRRKNLMIKRRSDGSRYVTRKTPIPGDHEHVDSAQGFSRSELPGEISKHTEYILETPRLSRKIPSDTKRDITTTIRRPRVSFGSQPTLNRTSPIEENVIATPHHSANGNDYPVMSNNMPSFGSDNTLHQFQGKLDTIGKISKVNIAKNTKNDVPLKSILKVRGASSLSANNDVTRSLNSVLQKPTNGQKPEVKEWVVKRRSDGSRYVTKISNNNNNNTSERRSAEYQQQVPVHSNIHDEDNHSKSDVIEKSHKSEQEPGQRLETWRSGNGRNHTVEQPCDERNDASSGSKITAQHKGFSASDSSINRDKRHRLGLHRDVDMSNVTLLAVL